MEHNFPTVQDEALRKELDELFNTILAINTAETFLTSLKNIIESLPEGLRPIIEACYQNLYGVIRTTTIPVSIALNSVMDITFSHRAYYELINFIYYPPADSPPDYLFKRTQESHIETLSTLKGAEDFARQFLNFMRPIIHFDRQAIDELHRQALVLIWSSFEILIHDSFVWLINTIGDCWRLLAKDPSCCALLPLKNISLELVSNMGFDLKGKLGDYLLGRQDFSNLKTIRVISNALCPELSPYLAAHELWILNQRRHLIVHRRGRVDHKYIQETGDKVNIGDQLFTTPKEIKEYLKLIRDLSIKVAVTVSSISSSSGSNEQS